MPVGGLQVPTTDQRSGGVHVDCLQEGHRHRRLEHRSGWNRHLQRTVEHGSLGFGQPPTDVVDLALGEIVRIEPRAAGHRQDLTAPYIHHDDAAPGRPGCLAQGVAAAVAVIAQPAGVVQQPFGDSLQAAVQGRHDIFARLGLLRNLFGRHFSAAGQPPDHLARLASQKFVLGRFHPGLTRGRARIARRNVAHQVGGQRAVRIDASPPLFDPYPRIPLGPLGDPRFPSRFDTPVQHVVLRLLPDDHRGWGEGFWWGKQGPQGVGQQPGPPARQVILSRRGCLSVLVPRLAALIDRRYGSFDPQLDIPSPVLPLLVRQAPLTGQPLMQLPDFLFDLLHGGRDRGRIASPEGREALLGPLAQPGPLGGLFQPTVVHGQHVDLAILSQDRPPPVHDRAPAGLQGLADFPGPLGRGTEGGPAVQVDPQATDQHQQGQAGETAAQPGDPLPRIGRQCRTVFGHDPMPVNRRLDRAHRRRSTPKNLASG